MRSIPAASYSGFRATSIWINGSQACSSREILRLGRQRRDPPCELIDQADPEEHPQYVEDQYAVVRDRRSASLRDDGRQGCFRLVAEGLDTEDNVVGVDIEFVPPANPDIVIENNEPFREPDLIAKDICEAIRFRQ